MAKKQEKKWSAVSIIDKIVETLTLWTVPVAGTIGIWWGFDASVYVAAVIAALNNVLECVKMFLK